MASDHEQDLTADIVELATRFGRYGYRRITALLREAWVVGEPQAGREDLETGGGLKVPPETTEEREAVAKRWVMRASETARGPTTYGPMTS